MRYLAILIAGFLLAPRSTTSGVVHAPQDKGRTQASAQSIAAVDSVVRFLLASAASDFHTHGPSGPLRFRDVRMGHLMTGTAETLYRICGQFMQTQQGVNPQWTPFATIKTSGYEHLIGAQALAFCQDSSIVWDKVGDLTSSLQKQYDASR